jgi:Spy/CpxP family protein refolding chaperone
MRTRTWTSAALVTLLGAVITMPAAAQGGSAGRGMRAGIGCAEYALRFRDRLELNEQQISQLEEVRASCVERRQARQTEVLEMRSELLAGDITREEFRTAMAARREADQAARDSTRTRVEAILTPDQLKELDRAEARIGMRGAPGFGRGFGWSQPGMRGRMGRGFRGWRQPAMGGRGMRLRIHR